MGLFSSKPSIKEVNDWLLNIIEALEDSYEDVDYNSISTITAFTIINSFTSTYNVFSNIRNPNINKNIGEIFFEFKGYYECLWQLVLIGKYEQEEVGKVFPLYQINSAGLFSSLFENSLNAKKLFSKAFSREYDEKIPDFVINYIQDSSSDNSEVLSKRINDIIRLDKSDLGVLSNIIKLDTIEALNMELIKKFDLDKFDMLELPPEFYK
jgi:hypothetical protein